MLSSSIATLFILHIAQALNILVWSPTYGQSHVNFMGNIAETLYSDGHNVTMLLVANDRETHDPSVSKDVNVVHYVSPLVGDEEWSELHYKKSNIFHLRTFELRDYLKMEDINYRICQSMLNNDFLKRLKDLKFDALFVELFHFCPVGISHIVGIPKIVLASALGMTQIHYETTSLPITLSNTPALLSGYSNTMSFVQRAYNVLHYYVENWLLTRMSSMEQKLFSSHIGNFPDLKELLRAKTDYILLNANEFTDPVRPIISSIKYIGGAHIYGTKSLPHELECLVNTANKGVILFSLGSLVNTVDMPPHVKNAFLEAFQHYNQYTVIWKDDLGSNSTVDNVHYRSWIPQVDLLANPRVKLFITHGGVNSIHEALHFGVPMIILPIFADQDSNAVIAEERGFAIKLNKFSITKDNVIQALKAILRDDEESSYSFKARQAARLLRGSPERMREEIRLVGRAAGEKTKLVHLTVNNDCNLYQYYNLDVYFLFVLILIGGLMLSIRFVDQVIFLSKVRK